MQRRSQPADLSTETSGIPSRFYHSLDLSNLQIDTESTRSINTKRSCTVRNMQCSNKTITFIGAEHINGTSSLSFSEAHVEALRYRTTMYWSCTYTKEKVEETYLNLAGENTPIQSSAVGLGLPISTVTHSVSSPCRQKKQGKEEPGSERKKSWL